MINLDAMDEPELLEAAQVFALLVEYARAKAFAQSYRKTADIELALKAESQCDRIYAALPKWARW